MSRGLALVELLSVLLIVGVISAISVPRIGLVLDSLAVGRAVNDLSAFYHAARLGAVFRGARVRLQFASDSLVAHLESVPESLLIARPGPGRHGVRLTASRSVIRIQQTGIGWGAANTKIVLTRGRAADSLATSRLGRLRRIR